MNPAGNIFKGVIPILVTPFDDDEALDLASLNRLVDFMAGIGVDGVSVLGILGEANRLTDDERKRVVATAVKAAGGRIPVVVGTNHMGTKAVIELSRMAAELGAEGLLIAPIKEPVPNEQNILTFYQLVAKQTTLPICVQDHPAATDIHMPVPLILKIIESVASVKSVKVEAVPSPVKFTALKKGMARDDVTLLTGLGALYGFFDLECGGDGFMTGFAFPEVLMALTDAFARKDIDRAFGLYRQYLPLIVFEQQPGVAIRKELYLLRKIITCNQVRHPAKRVNTDTAAQLRHLLGRVLGRVDLSKSVITLPLQ